MEERTVHELTAPYALDALGDDDRRAFEEHLPRCTPCREELADLSQTAALLAHGAPAATPPPALRERILSEARRNRGATVIPFPRRSRVFLGAAGVVTAAAAAIAIAFGVHSASISDDLDASRAALEVLSDPAARAAPLRGADGSLVVGSDGAAALVVEGLRPAPQGKTYELWVIRDGAPSRAGLFEGGDEREVVLLDERVEGDATVAVTLEEDGGVDAPTTPTLFSASAT